MRRICVALLSGLDNVLDSKSDPASDVINGDTGRVIVRHLLPGLRDIYRNVNKGTREQVDQYLKEEREGMINWIQAKSAGDPNFHFETIEDGTKWKICFERPLRVDCHGIGHVVCTQNGFEITLIQACYQEGGEVRTDDGFTDYTADLQYHAIDIISNVLDLRTLNAAIKAVIYEREMPEANIWSFVLEMDEDEMDQLSAAQVRSLQEWIESRTDLPENVKHMKKWLCDTQELHKIPGISEFKQYKYNNMSHMSRPRWQVQFLYEEPTTVDAMIQFHDDAADVWFRATSGNMCGFLYRRNIRSLGELQAMFSQTQWNQPNAMDIFYEFYGPAAE